MFSLQLRGPVVILAFVFGHAFAVKRAYEY